MFLLYVHRNRRFIRDGSPGRPPRLSHSSWALPRLPQVDRFYIALFSSQVSQQIGPFPTKRVRYRHRHPFKNKNKNLPHQPIRGNVRRTGRIFPKHVEWGFWEPELSFVAVRRISRHRFAKQKFTQSRTGLKSVSPDKSLLAPERQPLVQRYAADKCVIIREGIFEQTHTVLASELSSCVEVEVAVLASPFLISLMVYVDVKQLWIKFLPRVEWKGWGSLAGRASNRKTRRTVSISL